METNRFVSDFSDVILTWQTYGQRSSRAAESKHRALGNYVKDLISYVCIIPKCRETEIRVLCTFWVLVKRELLRNAKFRFFLRAKHVLFSEVAIAQRFSFSKYKKKA